MAIKNVMAKSENAPLGNEICRISKGTQITGVLTSTSDIRIDGNFEGTIHTQGKLVIGESSMIKGKVFSQNCDMWGSVEGEVYVEDIVNLKSTATLTGSLKAPKIGIEVGAVFNGACNIITGDEYAKYLQQDLGEFRTIQVPSQNGYAADDREETAYED